ncbi:MAG: hypothetical protein HRF49_03325 [bacterium]|jgi:hypothetical protein
MISRLISVFAFIFALSIGAAFAQSEGTAPPEDGNAKGGPVAEGGKDEPVDLSIAPAPRHDIAGPDSTDVAYSRVEFVKGRNLPNWTYTYKVFDADREFRGRMIVRKFEADDLRFGRLVVLDKEYMFPPQRVIRMAYRKEGATPLFSWMTYQFGDEEKKFTADYYYDQIFVRNEGETVFYHNAIPNPPASFDIDQLIWIVRQIDIGQLSGWRLMSVNVPTLEESYQVRVTREDDVEVKAADFKKYSCAHLVFDFGYVNKDDRVKEHYFVELAEPYRVIQYASGNILMLYESERQGSGGDDLMPGQNVQQMPELPKEGEASPAEGETPIPPPAESAPPPAEAAKEAPARG